jgi:hypothetical protein
MIMNPLSFACVIASSVIIAELMFRFVLFVSNRFS